MSEITEVIESAIHRIKLKGTDIWKRYSYWTKAKDVEFETGKNAEQTVADINKDISNEITRATTRENEIEKNLNSEISRATNVENTLESKKVDKTTVATSSTLGLVKSGTDITVDNSGNVSVNDNSHKHTVSNISDLIVTATELNYVDGITSNIQNQLNTKAPLASPTLTGTPKAPTASAGTNTAQIATTEFVQTAIGNLINGAPETANTLKELSDLIEESQDVEEALNAAIGTKANASDLATHVSDTTVHITSTERTNWNDANSKKHTHSNKSILDDTTASYTAEEKSKLSGIATGAEVNQNAFSNIAVGNTTISADSKTDTLTFVAGDNVTLTPDSTNDKVTISAKDTTYSNATTSTSGLMSASDKTKLDGIESGANNYTLPTASSTLGGVKTTSTVTSSSGYTACPIISGVPYYKEGEGTTYNTGTSTTAGITKLYTTTGSNTDGTITQSALSEYINSLNEIVGTTDSTEITIYKPNLTTNETETYTNIMNQTLNDAIGYSSLVLSNAIINLNKDVKYISDSQIETLNNSITSIYGVLGTDEQTAIKYSIPNLVTNAVETVTSSDSMSFKSALRDSTNDISSDIIALNTTVANKVTTGSEATLSSVHIGTGDSFIYDEDGGLNFRFTDSDGVLGYTNVRDIHAILNGYKTGSNVLINPVTDLNYFNTGVALFSGEIENNPIGGWVLVVSAGDVSTGTVSQRAYNLFTNDTYYRYCADNTWADWSMSSGACPDRYWNAATAFYPYGNIAVFRTTDDSGYAEVQANTFTAYTFNNMSSKYAKENIENISEDEASKILKLRPVKFDYINGKKDNAGLIAEEVLEIMPQCVTVPEGYVEDPNASEFDLPKIDYSKFVPYLIKELQVLNDKISKLESDMV